MERDAAVRRIVNLSDLDPRWHWFAGRVAGPRPLEWVQATALSIEVPSWIPRTMTWRRLAAGIQAGRRLESPDSVLVSHGPRMTMYGSMGSAWRHRRHLAYSFNFTDLPHGSARRVMAASFKSVDRFVCFSTMERSLYARHFDIDPARIDMIHWAADAPAFDRDAPRAVQGEYLCAIGSQGRDYATLLQAMATLPRIRLVLVATPESVQGLRMPDNVELLYNIPLERALNVLLHSRFCVIPLRDAEVPCGHVTIVSAMHSHKATIVSGSSGVADYIEDGVNGLAVPPRDPPALARAIEALWADPVEAGRLAEAAKDFAERHCSARSAIGYFERYLASLPTELR